MSKSTIYTLFYSKRLDKAVITAQAEYTEQETFKRIGTGADLKLLVKSTERDYTENIEVLFEKPKS